MYEKRAVKAIIFAAIAVFALSGCTPERVPSNNSSETQSSSVESSSNAQSSSSVQSSSSSVQSSSSTSSVSSSSSSSSTSTSSSEPAQSTTPEQSEPTQSSSTPSSSSNSSSSKPTQSSSSSSSSKPTQSSSSSKRTPTDTTGVVLDADGLPDLKQWTGSNQFVDSNGDLWVIKNGKWRRSGTGGIEQGNPGDGVGGQVPGAY